MKINLHYKASFSQSNLSFTISLELVDQIETLQLLQSNGHPVDLGLFSQQARKPIQI